MMKNKINTVFLYLCIQFLLNIKVAEGDQCMKYKKTQEKSCTLHVVTELKTKKNIRFNIAV